MAFNKFLLISLAFCALAVVILTLTETNISVDFPEGFEDDPLEAVSRVALELFNRFKESQMTLENDRVFAED